MDFQVIRRNKIGGHFEITVPPNTDIIVPYWLSGVHAGNEAWLQASGPCDVRFTLEHADTFAALMPPVADISAGNVNYIHGAPAAASNPQGFGLLYSATQGLMWSDATAMTAGKIIAVPLTASAVRVTTGTTSARLIIAGSS